VSPEQTRQLAEILARLSAAIDQLKAALEPDPFTVVEALFRAHGLFPLTRTEWDAACRRLEADPFHHQGA